METATLERVKLPTKWKEVHLYFKVKDWVTLNLDEEEEEEVAEETERLARTHQQVLFAVGYCDHPHGHKHYYPKLGDAKPTLKEALAKFKGNPTVDDIHLIIFGFSKSHEE